MSFGYGEENLHLYRGEALNTILNVARHEQYDLVIVGSQSGAGHFRSGQWGGAPPINRFWSCAHSRDDNKRMVQRTGDGAVDNHLRRYSYCPQRPVKKCRLAVLSRSYGFSDQTLF
ncbi:MAG: hypothetical protein R2932_09820 [Caldilineaceae bacterium]